MKKIMSWIFAHLPQKLLSNAWLMETIGVLIPTIPMLWLLSHITVIRWIQSGLTWAFYQWLSVEYEERWDPNGWEEGQDVLMRLLISTVVLVLYAVIP